MPPLTTKWTGTVEVVYEYHEQKYKEDTTGQDTRTNQWQKTHHMLLWEWLHKERYDWYVKVAAAQ